MNWKDRIAAEPWRFSFFNALARQEALNDDRPRIGDSAARRQEYLDLGQVPHLDFGASNIASFEPKTEREKSRLRVKFLGMLGPMGPLPIHTTEEALTWFARRDDAFVRFLDIFNNRFLQLFYRAHADCRPANHASRPADDRFRHYVGSTVGIGTNEWRDLDSVPDFEKLDFAGLLGPRVKSAPRIAHLVMGVFDVKAEIDQFIGTFLVLSREEQSRLGFANSELGRGAMAGGRVLTVDTKFRIRIFVQTLDEYQRFLPGRDACERLVDLVSNAVGLEYDWDVELVLPDHEVQPTRLGSFGQLGWTSWVKEPGRKAPVAEVRTRFSPLDENGRRVGQ